MSDLSDMTRILTNSRIPYSYYTSGRGKEHSDTWPEVVSDRLTKPKKQYIQRKDCDMSQIRTSLVKQIYHDLELKESRNLKGESAFIVDSRVKLLVEVLQEIKTKLRTSKKDGKKAEYVCNVDVIEQIIAERIRDEKDRLPAPVNIHESLSVGWARVEALEDVLQDFKYKLSYNPAEDLAKVEYQGG